MIKQLILLIILSFLLRIAFVFNNSISFHYDMSRDAYQARNIYKNGDLKIIGPPTSTPGLYHGPLYYYLIAPFYFLGQGDPRYPAIFLSFLNSLTIIPLFLLTKEIFKKNYWGLLAGVLFAFSFEASQYGPWLSNPQPAMLTVVAFFYSLSLWLKGKRYGLYLSAIFASLSTQFQFFLIYLFVIIVIFKFLFRIKLYAKDIAVSSVISLLILSSFIISAYKFNSLNLISHSFLGISISTQIDFRTKFSDLFLNYTDRFADLFINNFFPVNVFLGGFLGFIVLYSLRKERFILFCLLSNCLIFIFGGHSSNYANIGLVAPAILGVLYLFKKIKNKLIIFLLLNFILLANLYTIFKNAPLGQVSLVIPKEMLLKNQLALVDKTYQKADGKSFSINTLTLPLWTNTTWAYLYSWYGQKKYGFVPKFYGRDQVGLLGVNDLVKIDKPQDISFFIIEPHTGIPSSFYDLEISSENAKTQVVEKYNFNGLILETRIPLKNDTHN